jgi:glycine/D-amino acid oxidase-like deaminating enzyme
MPEHSAIVVGGGLAGMVIARELALRGWRVVLLEKSKRLGGKAGADLAGGRLVEHGYHVFPKWYPNVRAILDRIGVRLIDFDRYYFLERGQYPRMTTTLAPTGLGAIWHNTFHGMLPWYHNILYNYSVLDMISRPLSEKSTLDRVSQIGLVRGKWYSSEAVAEFGQEQVLKASAIPGSDLSAMTAKRVATYWVRQAAPFLSALPGDLQTTFIDPQTRELEALGVEIRRECEVTGVQMREGRVAAVETSGGAAMPADTVALCTPFEVTRKWLTDDLYQADPELGNLHYLEAQPMAALHLRLRKPLPDLPREHIFFHASRHALSLIEVGRLWGEPETQPHLSFISSDYAPLNEVSEQRAADLLFDEIRQYLPIAPADIRDREIHPNVHVPLFINTIGAWPNRPRGKTAVPNLYVAGDYVKNAIDLACMEGAVSAALNTAGEMLRDAGETGGLPSAAVPPEMSRALTVALRIGLIPVVAVARGIAWVEEWAVGARG